MPDQSGVELSCVHSPGRGFCGSCRADLAAGPPGRVSSPDHLPFGTYVEEGPDGYRVWFSRGEGDVEDVTDLRVEDRRYFVVAEQVSDA